MKRNILFALALTVSTAAFAGNSMKVEDDTIVEAADDAAACFWVPLREVYVERFGLRSIRQAVHTFLQQNC